MNILIFFNIDKSNITRILFMQNFVTEIGVYFVSKAQYLILYIEGYLQDSQKLSQIFFSSLGFLIYYCVTISMRSDNAIVKNKYYILV